MIRRLLPSKPASLEPQTQDLNDPDFKRHLGQTHQYLLQCSLTFLLILPVIGFIILRLSTILTVTWIALELPGYYLIKKGNRSLCILYLISLSVVFPYWEVSSIGLAILPSIQIYSIFWLCIISFVSLSYRYVTAFLLICVVSNFVLSSYYDQEYKAIAFEALKYVKQSTIFVLLSCASFAYGSIYYNKLLVLKLTDLQKIVSDLEQQNAKKTRDLQYSKESKDKLILSLSHEFRNPINAALGNIELAQEGCTDEVLNTYLVNCKVSIEMLFHLASNLLDASKLDSGVLEMAPVIKDVGESIKKVWDIVKEQLTKKNVIGEIFIDKNIPMLLKFDSHFFMKVLLNLLLNAIKFTNNGAVMAMLTWIDQDQIYDDLFRPSTYFRSHFLAVSKAKFNVPNLDLPQQSPPIRRNRTFVDSSPIFEDIPSEQQNNCFPSKILPLYQMPVQISLESVADLAQNMKNYARFTNQSQYPSTPMNEIKRRPKTSQSGLKKGLLKIEVFDSGTGIDQSILKSYLFKKFSNSQRRDSTHDGNKERLGTGLGLWLTREVCQLMGGDVRAYSQANEGSQFVAVVPIEVAEIQEARKINNLWTDHLYTIQKNIRLKALVVDDDKYNRDISSMFLKKYGVIVEAEAANGQEAVQIFKNRPSRHFDLIVMDIEMPIMNGKQASKAIRDIEKERGDEPVQLIIATGNCDKQEHEECMNENGGIRANFFYRKPVTHKSFEEFISIIKKKKSHEKGIIIVERDKNIVNNLQEAVKNEKFQIYQAMKNQDAFQILKEKREKIEIVLLNVESVSQKPNEFYSDLKKNTDLRLLSTRVKIIGYGLNLTDEKKKFFKKWLQVSNVIKYPFSREDFQFN